MGVELFVTVEKNGVEDDQFLKSVWDKMMESGNTEGFKLIPSAPPEVEELARKRTVELKPLKPEGEVAEIVEVKAKAGRPKK